MPKTRFDDFEQYHPETRAAWREWLQANGEKSPGVWFVYNKKASGKTRVSYDEAVEEALCFGWIDSLPRKSLMTNDQCCFLPRENPKAAGRASTKSGSKSSFEKI